MLLYNDDCFNIFPTIKDNKVDLVLVDLPYGQLRCEWDKCIDLERMWEQLFRVCKPTAVYLFFCTTRFGNSLINSNTKDFRYDMVWVKNRVTGFLQSKKQPLRSHEMIYVFYKKSGVYNPQMTLGTPYRINGGTENIKIYKKEPKLQPSILNTGIRYPKSILTYDKPSRSRHTSQKPTDLLENLILQYSNEGDTVLDFCMGSGSTGVACLRTGREFIGIELNTTFYEIARDRLHEEHMLLESL